MLLWAFAEALRKKGQGRLAKSAEHHDTRARGIFGLVVAMAACVQREGYGAIRWTRRASCHGARSGGIVGRLAPMLPRRTRNRQEKALSQRVTVC